MKVVLVIATPAVHASGDLMQYYGDEAALNGQPIIDATGTPTRNTQNQVITYVGTTFTTTESETRTYTPTGGVMKISLLAPPLSGHPVTVTVGSVTLGSSDFSLSGGVITITRTIGLTVGATIVIGYTAGIATETKHESYYYVPTSAAS